MIAVQQAFCYRRTEDPTTDEAFLRQGGKRGEQIGWVRRVPGGWGYRTSETIPWTYGAKHKFDAARELHALFQSAKKALPETA